MKTSMYERKVLHINLTTHRIDRELLDERTVRDFVGGWGIGHRLAYDLIRPEADPMSPENVIIFGTGALAGTPAPGTAKMMATTKLPVNSNVGTPFGSSGGLALARTGYGHVALTGRAEHPTLLKIFDDDIEICDAKELWGKDIYQTTDELRQRYGSDCTVIAIGPAGEKLSLVSFSKVNKASHLGRGGMAAVMGSNNLKAIVIRGGKRVGIADRERFMKLADSLRDCLMNVSIRPGWIRMGAMMEIWEKGRRPEEGCTAGPYGVEEYDKVFKSAWPCPACPTPCKFLVELREGDYAGQVVPVENMVISVPAWKKFEPGDLHRVFELVDLCDRNGLDGQEIGYVIDFAIRLFEDGVISREEADGMELKRDYRTAKTLINKIVRREGLGDLLADGVGHAVKRIGRNSAKYAITIKGQVPFAALAPTDYFEPRKHNLTASFWAQLVCPRGPYLTGGQGPGLIAGRSAGAFERYMRNLGISEEAIARVIPGSEVNIARFVRYGELAISLLNCVGLCARQPYTMCFNIEDCASMFTALTGLEMDTEGLRRAADRSWNLLKALNARQGQSRKDDEIPEAYFEPLVVAGETRTFRDYYGNPIGKVDTGRLLDDYYDERGWDIKTGIPTRETLLDLRLDNVVNDFEKRGIF